MILTLFLFISTLLYLSSSQKKYIHSLNRLLFAFRRACFCDFFRTNQKMHKIGRTTRSYTKLFKASNPYKNILFQTSAAKHIRLLHAWNQSFRVNQTSFLYCFQNRAYMSPTGVIPIEISEDSMVDNHYCVEDPPKNLYHVRRLGWKRKHNLKWKRKE